MLDAENRGYIDAVKLQLICRKLGEDLSVEEVRPLPSHSHLLSPLIPPAVVVLLAALAAAPLALAAAAERLLLSAPLPHRRRPAVCAHQPSPTPAQPSPAPATSSVQPLSPSVPRHADSASGRCSSRRADQRHGQRGADWLQRGDLLRWFAQNPHHPVRDSR